MVGFLDTLFTTVGTFLTSDTVRNVAQVGTAVAGVAGAATAFSGGCPGRC